MLWKNRNKRVGLCVTVMAGCLMLTTLWAVLAMPETALAKGADKDMPLCIDFGAGEITPSENPLCDSTQGVTALAGRRRTIILKIHKRTEDPNLVLSLGPKLVADIVGPDVDPDPATDGGYFDGPGQPECPLPVLASGLLSEPRLHVGISVNVKDIDPETLLMTNGRLIFIDDVGQEYQLIWGSDPQPSGAQLTNPSAPDIRVFRNPDDDGKRNWDVNTNPENGGDRDGAHTAFLWWVLSPHGPHDYCGAYDVSFNYFAKEQ